MSTCPCCADVLLQQFQHGSLQWFCRSCWSEMPIIEAIRPIAAPRTHRLIVTPQTLSIVKAAPIAA
jgi:hypothetical protein